jgi:serine/threonine protein kinase
MMEVTGVPADGVKLVHSKKIGSGSFGTVYTVKREGVELAGVVVKKIKTRISPEEQHKYCTMSGKDLLQAESISAMREALILRQFPHEYIVRILTVEYSRDYISIYMEKAEMDLVAYLGRHTSKINLAEIYHRMEHMASGLHFLHSNNIMHRDLKPANVLIFGNSTKLCDFGLARSINVDAGAPETNTLDVGTEYYRAPEVSIRYGFSADIFSLGGTFVDLLLYGSELGNHEEYIAWSQTDEGKLEVSTSILAFLSPFPTRNSWLVSIMLSVNPADRPVVENVLSTVMQFSGKDAPPFDMEEGMERQLNDAILLIDADIQRHRQKIAELEDQKKKLQPLHCLT